MLGIEKSSNRIFGLDILRVVAIFFVVHGHGAFLLHGTKLEPLSHFLFFYEVDIFFVLTGFLIGSSFIHYGERNGHVDRCKVLRFYGRSALRILPCYYVMLFVNYLFVHYQWIPGNTTAFPLWQFITLTQNVFTPFYDFYWESWCLPIQWWFYIFFPAFLLLLTPKFRIKRVIPFLCVLFVTLPILYRIGVSHHAQDSFWWSVWIRKTVASRMDNVFFGVGAAWISYYFPVQWRKHALAGLLVGVTVLLLISVFPRHIGSFYNNVLVSSIAPVAIALCLPFFSQLKTYRSWIGKVITDTSVLSFAMYLTNLLICQVIVAHFSDKFQQWGSEGYLLYWLLVMGTSYVLHIAIEKPFMKIRARIQK